MPPPVGKISGRGFITVRLESAPRWNSKKFVSSFRREVSKQLDLRAARLFRKEFYANTNSSTGRIIKSSTISGSLRIDTKRTGDILGFTAYLDLKTKFQRWKAMIMEVGGMIKPTKAKVLTIPVPPRTNKSRARMFPEAKWIRTESRRNPKLRLVRGPRRKREVLFIGVFQAKMPAFEYFQRTSLTVTEILKQRFARSMYPVIKNILEISARRPF